MNLFKQGSVFHRQRLFTLGTSLDKEIRVKVLQLFFAENMLLLINLGLEFLIVSFYIIASQLLTYTLYYGHMKAGAQLRVL